MRRLDGSIPGQKSRMSVAFLLTAAKNQEDLLENRIWVGSEKVNHL